MPSVYTHYRFRNNVFQALRVYEEPECKTYCLQSERMDKSMKFKLTPLEKNWILYDVANSAFILLVSTIMPICFNYLSAAADISQEDYLAYWGYAASAATLVVALLGPALGTLSDLESFKKKFFVVFLVLGASGCLILGFIRSWLWFLLVFVLTKSAYSVSLILYDAMLPDVTTDDRIDEVSSCGYAWGYIGSCIPFLACLLLVLMYDKIGLSVEFAMGIAFLITSLWWLGCSLPLIKNYRQIHYTEKINHIPIAGSFKRLTDVFQELKTRKDILFFLVSFFFYIDGVYTIIDMATAYGQALGLDTAGLLFALLVTQIVAFPCALFFGCLSRKVNNRIIIVICILAYLGISVFAVWLNSLVKFWILAVLVGMFQGTIQAISRSYFAKIIPADRSGKYFGIYDICGKGASFAGTLIVSVVTQITGSASLGVGSLSLMFMIGLMFFLLASKKQNL